MKLTTPQNGCLQNDVTPCVRRWWATVALPATFQPASPQPKPRSMRLDTAGTGTGSQQQQHHRRNSFVGGLLGGSDSSGNNVNYTSQHSLDGWRLWSLTQGELPLDSRNDEGLTPLHQRGAGRGRAVELCFPHCLAWHFQAIEVKFRFMQTPLHKAARAVRPASYFSG